MKKCVIPPPLPPYLCDLQFFVQLKMKFLFMETAEPVCTMPLQDVLTKDLESCQLPHVQNCYYAVTLRQGDFLDLPS